MASTTSQLPNTSQAVDLIRLDDFIEYRISLKIHLYVLPIIVCIGIPGNILSFLVLVFSSFRKSTTSIYLASLSVLDTIILIISILWFISFHYPEAEVFRDGTCQFIHVVFYFSIHFDVLLLIAMTVERFIAVVFPLKAHGLISTKKSVMTIIGVGLFSLALNLHHAFTKGMITTASGSRSCWIVGDKSTQFFASKIYPWIDSFIYSILPMTSLFVLNTAMIVTMRRAMRKRQSLQTAGANDSTQTSQRQLTIMLLLVSFAFLILTGPIGIILMLSRYSWNPESLKEIAVAKLTHSIVDNMMYMNHAVNFAFYCMSGHRFRYEVKRIFCCRMFVKTTPGQIQSTTFKNSTDLATSVSTVM